MKQAMFDTQKQMNEYLTGRIKAVKKEIATREKALSESIDGKGREEFLSANAIEENDADLAWAEHIEWQAKFLVKLNKEARKYQKQVKD